MEARLNPMRQRLLCRMLIAGLGLALLAPACSNEQELAQVDLNFGYEYFPLAIGRSWTYRMDSVVFSPAANGVRRDSSRSLMREVLVDTLRSAAGELMFRGERYERKSDTLPWQFKETFALFRTERQAIRQEGHFQIVVLPFPIELQIAWDPAVYFDDQTLFALGGEGIDIFRDLRFAVVQTGLPYDLADSSLQQVIRVDNLQNDNANKDRSMTAWFAPNIGLVERQWSVLELNNDCLFCCDFNNNNILEPEEEEACFSAEPTAFANSGFLLHQRLIDYQ